jgi:inner membrane protein involved in colicin E2 resistance
VSNFIEMKLGEDTILIETTGMEAKKTTRSGMEKDVTTKIGRAFDKIFANKIVEQCKMLSNTFAKLKEEGILPKKVNTEFGLQFNGEGNVYVAKVGAQANFKITFEWEFQES